MDGWDAETICKPWPVSSLCSWVLVWLSWRRCLRGSMCSTPREASWCSLPPAMLGSPRVASSGHSQSPRSPPWWRPRSRSRETPSKSSPPWPSKAWPAALQATAMTAIKINRVTWYVGGFRSFLSPHGWLRDWSLLCQILLEWHQNKMKLNSMMTLSRKRLKKSMVSK